MNLATLSQLGAGGVVAIIAALYAFAKAISWITKVNSDREMQQADAERQREKQKEDRKRLEADAERQREDTRRLQANAEKRNKLAAKLRADNKHFKAFMQEVNARLNDINTSLHDIWKAATNPAAQGASPISLTDFGKELSREMDAAAWVRQHLDKARAETVGKGAFDIQQFCDNYAKLEQLDDDLAEKVKQIAYDNTMKLDHVLQVLSIELRDALLANDHEKDLLANGGDSD